MIKHPAVRITLSLALVLLAACTDRRPATTGAPTSAGSSSSASGPPPTESPSPAASAGPLPSSFGLPLAAIPELFGSFYRGCRDAAGAAVQQATAFISYTGVTARYRVTGGPSHSFQPSLGRPLLTPWSPAVARFDWRVTQRTEGEGRAVTASMTSPDAHNCLAASLTLSLRTTANLVTGAFGPLVTLPGLGTLAWSCNGGPSRSWSTTFIGARATETVRWMAPGARQSGIVRPGQSESSLTGNLSRITWTVRQSTEPATDSATMTVSLKGEPPAICNVALLTVRRTVTPHVP